MVSEIITLEGHIIDSRALSEVLDDINTFGGDFELLEVHIGQRRLDRSHARIEVSADTPEKLAQLIARLTKHGALIEAPSDVELADADLNGCFPENFYCTTNEPTFVRHNGTWHEVHDQEMDCGITYDPNADLFRCIPMEKVRRGQRVVVGQRGIRLEPIDKVVERRTFQYISSEIAAERPKGAIIRHIAQVMASIHKAGKRIALVGGAAIVHTDCSEHVVRLIEMKMADVLIATNALAVHDIELALFGTSGGIYVEKAAFADTGHEHPLRAINVIRRAGGIKAAVKNGTLTSGIMHACAVHDVEFRLVGFVRDYGPLPETICDAMEAQDQIRQAIRGADFVLMVASGNLSIATAYILPAWTPVVAVDINPNVLHKIRDRGTFQTIGLATDAETFFSELVEEVNRLMVDDARR
jgi:lysine-ketoglutarate reductase/saccharopine dehydrogenase-like protein (TIGR00300 family)